MKFWAVVCIVGTVLNLGTCLSSSNPREVPDQSCQQAQATSTMLRCTAEALRRADNELNRWYKAVMSKVDERAKKLEAAGLESPALRSRLIEAQRAWLLFRDKSCAVEESIYGEGSFAPLAKSSCLARTTWARVEDLQGIYPQISR